MAGRKKSKSTKQEVLEIWRTLALEHVGEGEIRAIQAELERRLGSGRRASRSYVAAVLAEAGIRVEIDDKFVDPWMDPPYTRRLKGLLEFGDFVKAEGSIRKLDAAYREYRELGDRVGIGLVRTLMLRGRQRAAGLASNPRSSAEKREEKGEIANWFRVWLEAPDLFADWLELRKGSAEFRRRFAANAGQSGQACSPADS
jgi:hypothetical protein